MKSILITVILAFVALQEEPPDQPHTNDPSQCTSYCYHEGGEGLRPKGVPEGVKGYKCEGDHCSKAASEGGENPCDENGDHKCTKWCAKVCCTCLAVCL